jgi:hypothetical protein
MATNRFGSDWWTRFRTPEDIRADDMRQRHEDPDCDCFEDCYLCLEQNEPVSLCCGEPRLVADQDYCAYCKQLAVFQPRVKGF